MTILQALPQVSLASYFLFSETDNLLLAEEAAKRSGEGLTMLELFNSAAKYLAGLKLPVFDNFIAELNIMAAEFSRSALGEDGMARDSLEQPINDPRSDAERV